MGRLALRNDDTFALTLGFSNGAVLSWNREIIGVFAQKDTTIHFVPDISQPIPDDGSNCIALEAFDASISESGIGLTLALQNVPGVNGHGIMSGAIEVQYGPAKSGE